MPQKAPTKKLAEEWGVTDRMARKRKAQGTHKGRSLASRERWEKARADRAEVALKVEQAELEEKLGRLIPVETIATALREIGEELKARLLTRDEELAVLNAGLSAEAQLKNNHESTLTTLARWREFAVKHGAKE